MPRSELRRAFAHKPHQHAEERQQHKNAKRQGKYHANELLELRIRLAASERERQVLAAREVELESELNNSRKAAEKLRVENKSLTSSNFMLQTLTEDMNRLESDLRSCLHENEQHRTRHGVLLDESRVHQGELVRLLANANPNKDVPLKSLEEYMALQPSISTSYPSQLDPELEAQYALLEQLTREDDEMDDDDTSENAYDRFSYQPVIGSIVGTEEETCDSD